MQKLIIMLMLLVVRGIFLPDATKAQSQPQLQGDSVRYEGRLYSFTWNDGFLRGKNDGNTNHYRLQTIDGKHYLKDYSSNSIEVSEDWKNGYVQGFALGLKQRQTTTTHNDSTTYNGKMVSKQWYNNNIDYKTAMMPGFSYNFIVPVAQDSLGFFHGVGIEYLFYGVVNQNENPGPSHVRFYGRLNLMKSSRREVINDAFAYTLGIDLSLEKNPKRNFLVPYFGLETGGISQKQFGTTIHFTPTFGIHLLSKKNIFASLQGGYMYPVKNFDQLRGYTAQASINVALW